MQIRVTLITAVVLIERGCDGIYSNFNELCVLNVWQHFVKTDAITVIVLNIHCWNIKHTELFQYSCGSKCNTTAILL